MKTAVVYWSGTGNTEAMAQEVEQGMKDAGAEAEVFEAAAFSGDKMAEYDAIAFGCPSMGDEELEDTEFAPMFDDCKNGLSGKKIGLSAHMDGETVNGCGTGKPPAKKREQI